MNPTRRQVLQALAAQPLAAQKPGNLSRPNILFLMADQHRGDCLHAGGNAAIHTPNLDR
jgi:arylsulfatase A-like enzyme